MNCSIRSGRVSTTNERFQYVKTKLKRIAFIKSAKRSKNVCFSETKATSVNPDKNLLDLVEKSYYGR